MVVKPTRFGNWSFLKFKIMKALINFYHCIFLVALMLIFSCKKEQPCEGFSDNKNNKPPIALAGPDQMITLPTDSVSLDGGSSSDPDGIISEWLWTKISGPASFNIVSSAATKTITKNLIAGDYLFELKVTDNGGLSAKDTVHVIVNSATNPPPVINCSADNLTWTLADNGMMALINPVAIAGTLDCSGFGVEFLIPSHYDVWVQYEGSSNWIHLDYVFRDAIHSAAQNIFLSSVIYNDPTGNDGPVSVPVVYAKPNSGIDFTKRVTVINAL